MRPAERDRGGTPRVHAPVDEAHHRRVAARIVLQHVVAHRGGDGDHPFASSHDRAIGVHRVEPVHRGDEARPALKGQPPEGEPGEPGRQPRAGVDDVGVEAGQYVAELGICARLPMRLACTGISMWRSRPRTTRIRAGPRKKSPWSDAPPAPGRPRSPTSPAPRRPRRAPGGSEPRACTGRRDWDKTPPGVVPRRGEPCRRDA